jgi:hypothetical protein
MPVFQLGMPFVCWVPEELGTPKGGRNLREGSSRRSTSCSSLIVCSRPSADFVDIGELLCRVPGCGAAEPCVEKVTEPTGFGIPRGPPTAAGRQLLNMAVGPSHRGQAQPVEPDLDRHLSAALCSTFRQLP